MTYKAALRREVGRLKSQSSREDVGCVRESASVKVESTQGRESVHVFTELQ